MKNKKRALRRHYMRVKMKRVAKYQLVIWRDPDNIPKATKKLVNNVKSCSCWMCGNPRRKKSNVKYQITMAEQIIIHVMNEDIDDYYNEGIY